MKTPVDNCIHIQVSTSNHRLRLRQSYCYSELSLENILLDERLLGLSVISASNNISHPCNDEWQTVRRRSICLSNHGKLLYPVNRPNLYEMLTMSPNKQEKGETATKTGIPRPTMSIRVGSVWQSCVLCARNSGGRATWQTKHWAKMSLCDTTVSRQQIGPLCSR